MKSVMAWIVAIPLANGVAHAADTPEWQSLFDGKSLTGWKQVNGTALYQVVDGAIVGTTREGTPNSFLATEKSYGDFVLEVEAKQTAGPTNSGVQFRSHSKPEVMAGRVHGPQLDLDPSEREWTGGLYDEAMSGWWYPGTLNPQPGLYKFNEWNRVRIEAVGPTMRTWVNDVLTAYVIDATYRDGFIALQVHSIDKPADEGRKIHWRNLRIKENIAPSPAEARIFVRNTLPNDLSEVERKQGWRLLWDGQSAAGWRSSKADAFPGQGWKMSNGELVVTGGGGGDIISEETFAAPPGAGDTHFSVMRGSKATPTIQQGAAQQYKPVLYIDRDQDVSAATHDAAVEKAIATLQREYPGVGVKRDGERWAVTVPERYNVGHEAHFAQVMEHFLKYLRAGKLPAWEVPNMLTKYATLMEAYELSRPRQTSGGHARPSSEEELQPLR